MNRESGREILAVFVLGVAAFLFFSTTSYSHQGDYLLGDEIQNSFGPFGLFVSHQLFVWVGAWGTYMVTGAMALWGVCLLCGKEISGIVWKLTAFAILLLTFASLEVAASESADFFPGGYYGQFFYSILLSRLSSFGAYVFLAFAILIALLISNERQFYPTVARIGRTAISGDHWKAAAGVASGGARLGAELVGRVRSLPRPSLRVSWPGKNSGDDDTPVSRSGVETAEEEEYEYVYEEEDEEEDEETEEETEDDGEEEEEEEEEAVKSKPTDNAPEGRKSDAENPLDIRIRSAVPVKGTSAARKRPRKRGKYNMPAIDLLAPQEGSASPLNRTVIQDTAATIEETLRHFKIEARVEEAQRGPVITQYELSLAAGIKVHKIVSLSDDLAMALKAESIRIVAPIPGKSTVGIEVPNRNRVTVGLRELLESQDLDKKKRNLPLALGKDIAGRPIIADLGEMPHLLIAGSTGSGKSVCINSIIVNLLMTKTPEEVKLILMDPKMVELSYFEEIPHLLTPVVTDMKKAPAVLNWLVDKMEERYELLALAGVRHLTAYNALGRTGLRGRLSQKLGSDEIDDVPDFLPYYVVIIDELADLMMSASKEVEGSITRLSQKSRAVGIHVILATQRPSVDVITGLIKANMPSRVSFHVASKVDSRTILDRNGAEKLLGQGDMLYLPPGTSNVIRAQGTFISDKEINAVVESVRDKAVPQFDEELSRFGLEGAGDGSQEDELYDDGVRIVLDSQRGSVTLLQRQLQIGYTRASRLMELMAANGLVGPFKGSKAREVYYTLDEWEAARGKKQ